MSLLTDNYRRQHREIVLCLENLARLLDEASLKKNSHEARSTLAALAGMVKVHLAGEDKALYPRLQASRDANTKALASAFAAELGGLGQAFGGYVGRFSTADAISSRAAQFVSETNAIREALVGRIAKEESQLYPLADKEGF
jgi:hypothetical protein